MKMRYTWFVLFSILWTTDCCCAPSCQNNSNKYNVTYFTKDYVYVSKEIKKPTVETERDAFSITFDKKFTQLCKGMFNITYPTYHLYMQCEIEEIEPGTFNDQKITSVIHLNNNKLSIIKSGTFKGLAISELDLSYNQITTVEKNAIVDMPLLNNLELSRNLIVKFYPESVVNTPSLLFFDLGFNKMTKLDRGLFKFMTRNDQVGISVGINEVEEIHPEAFEGIHLWNLNLTHNKIKNIPERIFNEHNLTYADFNHNLLNTLPNSVYEINYYSKLYLKENLLSCEVQQNLDKLANANKNIYIFYDNVNC